MLKKIKIIRAVTAPQSLGFIEPMIPYLNQKYEVQLLSSPGDNIDKICLEHHVVGHEVEMARRIAPIKDLKSLVEIVQVLRKEKPYMVHSMTPKAGLLCMIAAWLTRVPRRLHTFTGLVWPTYTGFKRWVLIFTDWITCACATHIIPEGHGVMNDLKQCVTKKRMKVLGYGNVKGVDMERFNPARFADVKKDASKFRFVFVGRIVGDKGINELVDAFDRLNRLYPATQLTLVGKYEDNLDPLKIETQKKIEEHPCIDACGPRYGDDLLVEYMKSDCFVMPSYREGFPNTVMEAGAMGLPSVVTDINGSREIIINGENGLIVPSKNADALFEAMKQMVEDVSSRDRMVANARPLINSRFEKSYVQECLIKYYEEII